MFSRLDVAIVMPVPTSYRQDHGVTRLTEQRGYPRLWSPWWPRDDWSLRRGTCMYVATSVASVYLFYWRCLTRTASSLCSVNLVAYGRYFIWNGTGRDGNVTVFMPPTIARYFCRQKLIQRGAPWNPPPPPPGIIPVLVLTVGHRTISGQNCLVSDHSYCWSDILSVQ